MHLAMRDALCCHFPADNVVQVDDKYTRAARGGSGGIKAVGNYAGSLLPQALAKKEGFDNVLYLDAAEYKYLEEVGTSNVFVVKGDTIYTPGVRSHCNTAENSACVCRIFL